MAEPLVVEYRRPRLVVLDTIEPGWTPPYRTYGRATCVAGCGEWLWLGDHTYPAVACGSVAPICRPCAARVIPPGTPTVGRIEDTEVPGG